MNEEKPMKFKIIFLLMAAVFAISCAIPECEAQLIKNSINVKGGGGTDITELISIIPNEAQIILSVNWENLMKAGLIDLGINSIMEDADIKAINNLGIDFKKDIKHVVLGLDFDGEAESGELYVVAAGTFDSKKIIEKIKASGNEIEEKIIKGKTVYFTEDTFFAFTDKLILFANSEVGDDSAIKRLLETDKKNLANNPEMAKLIKETDTSATAWGAAIIPQELKAELAEEEETPFDAKALQTATFSINCAEKLTAKATIKLSEAGEAAKFVKFLTDQMIALDQEKDVPAIVRGLAKNLKITANDKSADAIFEIETKKLQEMINSEKQKIAGTKLSIVRSR
jgi:hypothetical protein